MLDHDQIARFTIENTPIRGQMVSLDASWQKCLQNSELSVPARNLLGDALAAVTLLGSTLKLDGKITLQIRGQGAIHLLVAQATSQRSIRGMVRQSAEIKDTSIPLNEIFQADKIVITIDSGHGKPYQGIVPLIGHSLAQALESYFDQSEQLPTRLWLASDQSSASGLLLQKLPGELQDEDSWNRVTHLASTITRQELLQLSERELLKRLFHEEVVRLYDSEPVRFECSCSRERTQAMIKSLGHDEAESILEEQGTIEVNCEFCNASYVFDPIDIEQLFQADTEFPTNLTRH